MTKIAVIGGGAMATACALLLNEQSAQQVSIWMRDKDLAQEITETRENKRLLPGVEIPEEIEVTGDIESAANNADFILVAIPSAFLRESLTQLAPAFPHNCAFISVVKGIEQGTHQRPSQIITDVMGNRSVIAVGGPSHAEEISRRLPATVVAACEDLELAKRVQSMLGTERFRVYANNDLIGVELAGAVKNVIAIAAGICDGLGYGDNAKSALMTRGIVEMARFGAKFGADPSTFSGLAGIGDLITTCVSPFGRNRMVGERLGKGEKLPEILASMKAVAEGVKTTEAVHQLALEHGVEMPITAEGYAVLFEEKSPQEATESLMGRPFKVE